MNPSFIIPFVKSVKQVFETMIQLPVEVGKPGIKQNPGPSHDISGIIGMSGDVEGAVVLSFPVSTAERVVSLFTGTPMTKDHEDFADAIGELVNMISGGAKAQFAGRKVSISCPSVVVGGNHTIFGAKDVTSIVIPCTSDSGEFAVEVSIRQTAAAMRPAAASA